MLHRLCFVVFDLLILGVDISILLAVVVLLLKLDRLVVESVIVVAVVVVVVVIVLGSINCHRWVVCNSSYYRRHTAVVAVANAACCD